MTLHAMRIELLDEPSSLARVAGALGRMDANIVEIDVHELDGLYVVDEIVIESATELAPGRLRDGLLEAGAVSVVSVPASTRRMDAVVRCLDAITGLVGRSDVPLQDVIADIVPVDDAAIRAIAELDHVDPGLVRLRWGIPVAQRQPLPAGRDGWVLAVPRTEGAPVPFEALVVSRAGIRFSATEVARLRALLRVYAGTVAIAPVS